MRKTPLKIAKLTLKNLSTRQSWNVPTNNSHNVVLHLDGFVWFYWNGWLLRFSPRTMSPELMREKNKLNYTTNSYTKVTCSLQRSKRISIFTVKMASPSPHAIASSSSASFSCIARKQCNENGFLSSNWVIATLAGGAWWRSCVFRRRTFSSSSGEMVFGSGDSLSDCSSRTEIGESGGKREITQYGNANIIPTTEYTETSRRAKKCNMNSTHFGIFRKTFACVCGDFRTNLMWHFFSLREVSVYSVIWIQIGWVGHR